MNLRHLHTTSYKQLFCIKIIWVFLKKFHSLKDIISKWFLTLCDKWYAHQTVWTVGHIWDKNEDNEKRLVCLRWETARQIKLIACGNLGMKIKRKLKLMSLFWCRIALWKKVSKFESFWLQFLTFPKVQNFFIRFMLAQNAHVCFTF